ncbi:MAG: family peptidase, partial [Chitinophagaceae bacterium]|nr:family peptidase [Chitinophagaceae bacterium]
MKTLLTVLSLLILVCPAIAQVTEKSKYDQHEAFSPLPYMSPLNPLTRTPAGSPAKGYWQNRADYTIDAKLDTSNHTITGTVEIAYSNNSPDPLPYLWLQLDQEIFKDSSRAVLTSKIKGSYFADGKFEGGYRINAVTLRHKGRVYKADYLINDTRMQIRLMQPLESKEKIALKINYSFIIPGNRAIRMGRMGTSNGEIYQIAQWYPRMCVYDDVTGWNTLPYQVTGEFYLDYDDYDVSLDVPADMLVVASGELLNPQNVLTIPERSRLERARNSDTAISIRTINEVKIARKVKGSRVWHFSIKNSRDMVWAASRAFVWDAARINLPDGRKALAQSVFPVEAAGKVRWGRSTEFIKGVIEYNSAKWFPYPYPNAIHVAGKQNGMEYPGMVFSNTKLTSGAL